MAIPLNVLFYNWLSFDVGKGVAALLPSVSFPRSQILARALLECHEEASKEGHKFALEVFQSGRNRLENEGATALAQVFQVLLL